MNTNIKVSREKYLRPLHVAVCEVRLNDIEVMADIGALAVELGVPQPLLLNVTLSVICPLQDKLTETFDYNQIRDFALELAASRIVLIETFARRLAELCLEVDVVQSAEVRIDKPKAVPGCLAGTLVRIEKG